MDITTEVFVLVISLAGIPLLAVMLHGQEIGGRNYFFASYLCFVCSNVFTVIETYFFYDTMNLLEHLSITCGAVNLLLGVIRFIQKEKDNEV